jgi:hypothetical protein
VNLEKTGALVGRNNNYGLYEVVPGIYQVRGFDLSDISFVRGKTGWIVFDPLVSKEPVRAAWKRRIALRKCISPHRRSTDQLFATARPWAIRFQRTVVKR